MIELFDDFVIKVDDTQYILAKRYISKKKDGTESEAFKNIGYYSTLNHTIQGFTKRLVMDNLRNQDRTLTEAVETIREIADRVEKFVTENIPQEV